MSKTFEIIDGIVYVDKKLFVEAMHNENNISRLMGCNYTNLYHMAPTCKTGPESVIIDYSNADSLQVNKDPETFVEELRETYHQQVRGCLIIQDNLHANKELIINDY